MLLALPKELIFQELVLMLDDVTKWLFSSVNKFLRQNMYKEYKNSPVSCEIIFKINVKSKIYVYLINNVFTSKIMNYARENKYETLQKEFINKQFYGKKLDEQKKLHLNEFGIPFLFHLYSSIHNQENDEYDDCDAHDDEEYENCYHGLYQTNYVSTKNISCDDKYINIKVNDETMHIQLCVQYIKRYIEKHDTKKEIVLPGDSIVTQRYSKISQWVKKKDDDNDKYTREKVNNIDFSKYKYIRFIFKILLNKSSEDYKLIVSCPALEVSDYNI